MVDILQCCSMQSTNEPYIGVDQKCQQAAIFCIEHNPHKNSQGLMHQMLPLKHFKKTLMQKKFLMGEKIGVLIDQYNNLMDSLIEQIRELKLRKNIEFSMLWLRQLAKDEEQYELMRQVYRMDFKDLTCSLIHSIYFKIVHNQILEKKTVNQIDCYKGISQIFEKLSEQKQTRSFLSKKIAQIQGILENGKILKRALPDKAVQKANIKEVLLESPHAEFTDIKYNQCKLNKGARQYLSIFSKYPIVPYVLYHINFQTKYTNVMLGICTETLVKILKGEESQIQMNQSQQQNENTSLSSYDKHYSKESIVFNCTNGCVYKDGMFQSGNSALTKGQKELVLKMRLTSTNELLIMLGKNILCRQKIDNLLQRNQGEYTKLYLHVLLRTQGDSFDVDRDKDITGDQLPPKISSRVEEKDNFQTLILNPRDLTFNPRDKVNFEEIQKRNEEQAININQLMEEIVSHRDKNTENNQNGSESSFLDLSHLNSNKNLKSAKILTDEKSYRKGIIKDVKNIQQKNFPSFTEQGNRNVHFKKMSEEQKDTKINEIIKKQRIDKILNEIKSKPLTNMKMNENIIDNSIAGRKLREFQERKNSNQSINANTLNRIKQARNKIQLEEHEAKQRNLRPVGTIGSWDNNSGLNISNSSYQTSSCNLNSPMVKSSDLKPLLMIQKQQQKPSPSFPKHYQQGKFSPINMNHSDREEIRKVNKVHPSQKVFNLGQFDSSSNENTISDQSFHPSLGGMTPIDRFKEFEFSKKNTLIRNSPVKNGQDKRVTEIEIGQKQEGEIDVRKKSYNLPTLRQSEQNLYHSGAFNERGNDESQVIESYEVKFQSNHSSPKKQILGIDKNSMIPKLNYSQFSKIDQKSCLDRSGLEQSFGKQNAIKDNHKSVRLIEEESKLRKTPFTKPQLQNSIIDLGSEFRSDFSSQNSIHLGNIISPRQATKRTYTESSAIEKNFNMNQLDQEQCQSVIDIRERLA